MIRPSFFWSARSFFFFWSARSASVTTALVLHRAVFTARHGCGKAGIQLRPLLEQSRLQKQHCGSHTFVSRRLSRGVSRRVFRAIQHPIHGAPHGQVQQGLGYASCRNTVSACAPAACVCVCDAALQYHPHEIKHVCMRISMVHSPARILASAHVAQARACTHTHASTHTHTHTR